MKHDAGKERIFKIEMRSFFVLLPGISIKLKDRSLPEGIEIVYVKANDSTGRKNC